MSRKKEEFLCGVVEGFYGRPWTTDQRFDLFSHMSNWGMNSYLYAPKDDEKHRAYWRDLYTLEEAAELTQLIKETTSRGIKFIYAISPGLDITFSSKQEVTLLEKKLQQVVALGCTSFAILFDDIDNEMLLVDAKQFPSFAHAQVSITNEVYVRLGRPSTFLFCPTEYCASRAEPSVKESQYLKHIGEQLHPDIDIMWTGPKVISRVISEPSIDELIEVIQRPPVIWDNLHANDYDQRRLFLGPYVGRSVGLIPKLNGVLTNPNCEYGANYIPIHTLAQWSHCGRNISRKSPPIKQSILLEVEGSGEGGRGDEESGILCLYEPTKALELSLKEWFSEFQIARKKPAHYKPVKNAESISKANDYETLGNGATKMDTSSPSSSASLPPVASESMHMTSSLPSPSVEASSTLDPFTLDDMKLLVDYFYLPHKHGCKAVQILEEFCWLKENAPGYEVLKLHGHLKGHDEKEVEAVKTSPSGESGVASDGIRSDGETSESVVDDEYMTVSDVTAWCERASNFHQLCTQVNDMYTRLTAVPNRPLLYDLYQYVWDAKETTMLLDSYIAWLEAGGSEVNPNHEPHCPRGGITAEMQLLLPRVKGSRKLNHRQKPPPLPSPVVFTIRPYRLEDKELLYRTCLETGDNGVDATDLYTNYPNLLGDRFVGPYLELCRDLSFVLEDPQGVCGYVLAALDSKLFYQRFKNDWLPKVLSLYPLPPQGAESSPEVDLLSELHHLQFFLPDHLQREYPSHLHIDLMRRAQGQGIGVRMIKTILATLKAKGSHGVHLEMSAHNVRALKFYKKLGFKEMRFSSKDPLPAKNVLVLGRVL